MNTIPAEPPVASFHLRIRFPFSAQVSEFEIITRLGVALALGLLIGTERGWAERGLEDGKRIAGIRSFVLIGLLGALWALLSRDTSVVIVVLAFLAFGGLLIAAYWLKAQASQDIAITTEIAALIAFTLGAAAMRGHLSVTAAAAVVTTVLLGLKPRLHGWLERLEAEELNATLKLLLISVVVLPVLPDRGFVFCLALNPYGSGGWSCWSRRSLSLDIVPSRSREPGEASCSRRLPGVLPPQSP